MTEATYWIYQSRPVSMEGVLTYRHVPPGHCRVGICGNAPQDEQESGHARGAEEQNRSGYIVQLC